MSSRFSSAAIPTSYTPLPPLPQDLRHYGSINDLALSNGGRQHSALRNSGYLDDFEEEPSMPMDMDPLALFMTMPPMPATTTYQRTPPAFAAASPPSSSSSITSFPSRSMTSSTTSSTSDLSITSGMSKMSSSLRRRMAHMFRPTTSSSTYADSPRNDSDFDLPNERTKPCVIRRGPTPMEKIGSALMSTIKITALVVHDIAMGDHPEEVTFLC